MVGRQNEAFTELSDFWRKTPRAKLTENQALGILTALGEGDKLFTLSRRYGVSEALISRIKYGTCWRYLADDGESGNVFPAPHFA
jgi:hypothetical protein